MSTKWVVIIGQSPDPHIDRTVSHLERLGACVLVFDRMRHDHLIQLVPGDGTRGRFCARDRCVDFESVHSVWWRWKPQMAKALLPDTFDSEGERFASDQWRFVLRSLPDFLPDARWVNPVDSHFFMEFKPRQLPVAHAVGLRIPETIFSNDPDAIEALFSRHERVVYKPFTAYLSPAGETVLTNEIMLDDVRKNRENIRVAPGIFQELIEKEYELRVTIVGDRIFAARINSQEQERTRIDWRYDEPNEAMYETTTLDRELGDRLLEFHRRAELRYGAYDLVVPKSGSPVFLEVNPGGQWLWFEEVVGLSITEALAELLVS